jgi:hypothetical protein
VIVMTGLYSGPLIFKGPGVATGPVIGGISWPQGDGCGGVPEVTRICGRADRMFCSVPMKKVLTRWNTATDRSDFCSRLGELT